jgi:hypothetical protein
MRIPVVIHSAFAMAWIHMLADTCPVLSQNRNKTKFGSSRCRTIALMFNEDFDGYAHSNVSYRLARWHLKAYKRSD